MDYHYIGFHLAGTGITDSPANHFSSVRRAVRVILRAPSRKAAALTTTTAVPVDFYYKYCAER